MIKILIIECDSCKKEINTLIEHYYKVDKETGYEDLCDDCYETVL